MNPSGDERNEGSHGPLRGHPVEHLISPHARHRGIAHGSQAERSNPSTRGNGPPEFAATR
jgi:hypothetical protein